ncbi:MAG: cytochrome c oxidase subunit II [Planctomycetes bacterium]|nr:cytochrome c oxidase subunit II [Planctomycetota bacterium]
MKSLRRVTGLLLLLLALASPLRAAENLSIFDPVSPSGSAIRHVFVLVLAITGGIFVLVEGILIYSLVMFRRRGTPDGTEPPQVYGSLPIEIAWTVGPALVVFVLVLIMIRTELEVQVDPNRPPPGSRPLYVTVKGHQWWWEYIYERNDGKKLELITANELHVPASDAKTPRPVYLTLLSVDVCHSFWVPRLAGKTDLIPGRTNHMWFQTDQPGTYLGQCAEYCGTQHANMLLRVIVDTPAAFERWLADEMKDAVDNPAVRKQRDVFLAQSCVNCHRIRGTPAKGTFGPDLTHLMSRETLASGMVPNTRANLRQWIRDPQKIKPGCLMPDMKLSENEVDQVLDYLLTLR